MQLNFNDQQLTYIMQTLAARPWGEVAELIQTIQRQAAEQSQQRAGSAGNGILHDADRAINGDRAINARPS